MEQNVIENIIETFPAAEEIKNNSIDKYSTYFFEAEISSIFRLIIWAKKNNISQIVIASLSDKAFSFLEQKGYKILKNYNKNYVISWGE